MLGEELSKGVLDDLAEVFVAERGARLDEGGGQLARLTKQFRREVMERLGCAMIIGNSKEISERDAESLEQLDNVLILELDSSSENSTQGAVAEIELALEMDHLDATGVDERLQQGSDPDDLGVPGFGFCHGEKCISRQAIAKSF